MYGCCCPLAHLACDRYRLSSCLTLPLQADTSGTRTFIAALPLCVAMCAASAHTAAAPAATDTNEHPPSLYTTSHRTTQRTVLSSQTWVVTVTESRNSHRSINRTPRPSHWYPPHPPSLNPTFYPHLVARSAVVYCIIKQTTHSLLATASLPTHSALIDLAQSLSLRRSAHLSSGS